MSFRPLKPRAYGSVAEMLTRLYRDAGGVKRVAHLIKRSATQVYAYSDPQEDDEIAFDDVLRIVEACGSLGPAETLASIGGGFVTALDGSSESLGALMARGEREHGKAMALIVERLGRHEAGKLGAAERRGLARDIDEMIRAFVAARQKLGEEGSSDGA